MDFEIPEDLKMVQSLARDFVSEQLKPLERDIMGRAANLSDSRMYLPPETEAKLIKTAQEVGLWGVGVPEELGGVGFSTLGNCLIEEELAQTVVPFNFGDVTPILFDLSEKQREGYLLPVLNREKYAYLALLEPGSGSEPTRVKLKAERANGAYLLSGEKLSFSRAGKDYFALVFAVTGETAARDRVTCFLVDKDTPGMSITGSEERVGWRSRLSEPMKLVFDRCPVSRENVVGEEGKAFHLGKKWLPARRIVRAARCVGVARRLLEEATTQAQSLESFGQPVHRRTSIEAALADIAIQIHAARLVIYEAACKADEGKPMRHEVAMAKLTAAQMLTRVADRVSYICNGPPHIAGLPMESLCRHALATSAIELSLEVQSSILVRDILKGLKI